MNCAHTRKLLDAYHDGELDAAHGVEVDEHLADCPQCFRLLRDFSTVSNILRDDALRFSAPADLRESIRGAIARAETAEREPAPASRQSWTWQWAAAAILLLSAFAMLRIESWRGEDRLLTELTASHVRSLMANHLMDVASSDQHTVKPWFDGKLDFAPPVKDLKSEGFPLLGGRLDYLNGRSVAALVYGRQKHDINLFIWPAESTAVHARQATQKNGYHVVEWADGRMNLVAVSDLNEAELWEFAGLFSQP